MKTKTIGKVVRFALCVLPWLGASATEDGCVDLAPAGPVEGFESEDSGVEGVRKWLGLHAYADIESAYIIRGYVWDSRPCSMQFVDAELKLGEFGRFDVFEWSVSALSSKGHSTSMRNAFNEVDYGIRYVYDLRLADGWTLQNGVAKQWITNPGVRHNSRSLHDWQVFQSLNNPYVTPYWRLRHLQHPYLAAYWCAGLVHTFELTETLSFTIDGFGDLADSRHNRLLFGPKPGKPNSDYRRGLYALNIVFRLDWKMTEYLGLFAFVGQYCLVDRDARDAIGASSAEEAKRDLTFGGVGLRLDF